MHVLQAIALLDTLDKDVNTFVMRVREWYSWHFPELVKVCTAHFPTPCFVTFKLPFMGHPSIDSR